MSKQIDVAILTHAGGAHIGAYITALAAAPEVRKVYLADPSGRFVGQAKQGLGKKFAESGKDARRLLTKYKPTMALVSMEAAVAPAAIDVALDENCHVFAEKPACVRAEDFAQLVQKAKAKNRYLMLALANRLNPETQAAKTLVSQGAIGKVYGLEMHLIADQTRLTSKSYQKNWFAQKARAGGGHLTWLGIHWLDLAMYITGSKIQQVSGFHGVVGGQPIDVEDSAAVTMKFDNNTFGTLTSGYYLDRGYHTHLRIWGSNGWLEVDPIGSEKLVWYSRKQKGSAGKMMKFTKSTQPRGYSPFVRAAVRACAGLEKPPISADESLLALKTVYAFYDASGKGKKV